MNKKILFLSIFIFIIGLIGICALLVIDYAVKRRKKDEPSFHLSPSQEKWLKQQQIEHVQITSFDGLMLRGLLIKAKQESDKMVIAIHGYRMNNLKEYAKYLQFYHDAGFHILLPDNRAHGQSEGKYIGFGYLDKFDCLQWIDFVEKQSQKNIQIILHGISMGSATVLMASGEPLSQAVKCIISDCGYSSMMEEVKHAIQQTPIPSIMMKPAAFLSRYHAGYDFKKVSTIEQVKKSHTPTLFIHGDQDNFVPTKMVYELYGACPSQKELLIVKGAKHAQSFDVDPDLYQRTVLSFIQKYVK